MRFLLELAVGVTAGIAAVLVLGFVVATVIVLILEHYGHWFVKLMGRQQ